MDNKHNNDNDQPKWWRKNWKFDKNRERKAGEPWQDWTEPKELPGRSGKWLPEEQKCLHTWQETPGYFICRICGEIKRKPRRRYEEEDDVG